MYVSKFRNSKSKSLQKLKQKGNDVSHVVKQMRYLLAMKQRHLVFNRS